MNNKKFYITNNRADDLRDNWGTMSQDKINEACQVCDKIIKKEVEKHFKNVEVIFTDDDKYNRRLWVKDENGNEFHDNDSVGYIDVWIDSQWVNWVERAVKRVERDS